MLDPVSLTRSLCAIPSVTGQERSVGEYLAQLLKKEGFSVQTNTLPNSDRLNVFAKLTPSPKLLLTTHIDTVPPHFPVSVSDDGLWLVGRGVCDAKGIAAAMICSAANLKASGFNEVALLFVVGEETNSDGAKFAAEIIEPTFDYLIDGEPTDMKLVSSMKGALVFEMSAKGKAGHSAYPQSGHSALHQLIEDANKILKFDWPKNAEFGETTVNIGTLNGGIAGNVIAADAHLKCVMRLSCSVEEVQEILRNLINPETSVRFLSAASARSLEVVDGFETCTVSYGCDIPHLEKLGKPLLFGPGSILDAHTATEKVKIADLCESVVKYEQLCRQLLARACP